jgi:chromate transporter
MSETVPAPIEPPPAVPTLPQLFVAFSIVSLSGFGGVLAWSRRMMVEERKWMTGDEFNDLYALCNFLPGPNIVNFSVVFGRRFGGVAGAVVALVGLIGPPFGIVMILGLLYAYYGNLDAMQHMFAAVAAAAAGLTISTVMKMIEPFIRSRPGAAHVTAVLAFAAVGVLRWPLYWVLAGLIPLSIALAWWCRR